MTANDFPHLNITVEELLERALDEPTVLERLRHLTELAQFASKLQLELAPHRAAAIIYMKDDDRSTRWIAKKLGVTPQVIDGLYKRYKDADLPWVDPKISGSGEL